MLACLAFWAGVAVNAQAAAQHVFNLEFADVEVSVTEGTAKDNAVYFVQTAGQITRCYVLIPHQFENGEQPADRDYKISVAYDPATDWTIVGGAAGPAEDIPYSAGEGVADPEFRQGNSVTLAAATRTFDIPDPTEQDPERRSSRTVEVIAFTPGFWITVHAPSTHGEAGTPIARPQGVNRPYPGIVEQNVDNDNKKPVDDVANPPTDWIREGAAPGPDDDDFTKIQLNFDSKFPFLIENGSVAISIQRQVRLFNATGTQVPEEDRLQAFTGPTDRTLSPLLSGEAVNLWLEGGPEWLGSTFSIGYNIQGQDGGDTGAVSDESLLFPVIIQASTAPYVSKDGSNLPGDGSVHGFLSCWSDGPVRTSVGLIVRPGETNFEFEAEHSLTWDTEQSDEPPPVNSLEANLSWLGQFGLRTVTLEFLGVNYSRKIHVLLPDVGDENRDNATLDPKNIYTNSPLILGHQMSADQWYDELEGSHSHAERDALKHAYWAALCASDSNVNTAQALRILTAHEYSGKSSETSWILFYMMNPDPQKGPSLHGAYANSMDLHNNAVGFSTLGKKLVAVFQPETGEVIEYEIMDRNAIKNLLLQKLEDGDMLIFDGSGQWGDQTTNRFLIFSNGSFPYESLPKPE